MTLNQHSGFNLIELLITVSIIGILISLTVPIYSGYRLYEERIEAETALVKLAGLLEDYFTNNHTYQNASFEKLGLSQFAANQHYHLLMSELSDDNFTIEAEPILNQDPHCGTLLLNALGEKGIKGKGTIAECW